VSIRGFQRRCSVLGRNAPEKIFAVAATNRAPSHIHLEGRGRGGREVPGGVTVTLIEKIPYLSDEEVINLLANARRLQSVGDDKQRAQAAELITPLEVAADSRKAARLAAAQAKRMARRPKKAA
jgi:hypothetical protein